MDAKEDLLLTLRTTPELLRLAIMPVDGQLARTRPAPDRWSIVEIAAHLTDVEANVMQVRVTRMVTEDRPMLEAYDQEAECRRKKFIERDLLTEVNRFSELRRKSIASLERLTPDDCLSKGRHAELGEISVSELLNEWALHDLGHLRQIFEIRRARFWRGMGPFQRNYKVNP